MRRLLIISFLFCTQFIYGQDLIITVTGDSLKCKIIEIGYDDIQIRFGRSSDIISIKRSEMASYEYNYELMSSEKKPLYVPQQEKIEQPSTDYLPYFAALTVGVSPFGSVSFGGVEGLVFAFGADMAYFFNPWLGAGIKLNTMSSHIDFGEAFSYKDRVIFLGPALYGRFDISKMTCIASAGAGGCIWMMNHQISNNISRDNISCTSPGGFLSAGVIYSLTEQFGIGLNIQSAFCSMKNAYDYERKPAGIGGTLGINYKF